MGDYFCWIEQHPGLAGWLQAFFSVAAIIAAFGVAMYQIKAAKRHAELEKTQREDRLLRSVRIELIVLRDGFLQVMGISELPDVGTEPYVEAFYFPPDKPFAIYDSLAGSILDVSSDEKRKLIIQTYNKLKSVLTTLQMNNLALKARENQTVTSHCDVDVQIELELSLSESSKQFWKNLRDAMDDIKKIENTFPAG